jgi:hypothetical protein
MKIARCQYGPASHFEVSKMKKTSRNLYTILTALTGILVLSLAPALADHDKGKGKGKGHDDDNDGRNNKNSFRAKLSGKQEVPAISTNAEGLVTLRVGGTSSAPTVSYEIEYRDLKGGPAAAAHIHFGQKGANGGVMAFLCGGGGKPACPVAGTKLTGMLQASDVAGLAAQGIAAGDMNALLNALRSGLAYANVHNTLFPGGEIRGQFK